MRTSLWFLLFVAFYHHDKCVMSRDIPHGFQTTFQSVADFIKSFVAKSSSAARNIFENRHGGKDRKKLERAHKTFTHHAWEEGEAKYYTTEKQNSPAAYQLTVTEVAQWHGYNIETHMVKTMDGYFLTMHRLTGVSNLRNRTVLLHHGLLGSSMDWILLGPGECMLPFTLAEAGYDVWFMNARGNIYSRSHATMTLTMPEFWDFSFEEMGLIDIPAVINYIRKQNDVPIDFVAHSMGSTAFLVFLSSFSEYTKYLRTGVLIAPVAFMRNVTGPLMSVPEDTFKPSKGEFLPHRKVPRKLAIKYCKGPIRLCRNPLFFLSGVPSQRSFTARVRDHVPAGGSVNTILHYMQLAKSGMFHSFKNKMHKYDMYSIDVPLALISSNNDELAIVKNVQRIYELIKYPIAHYIIRNKNVSHTDLLWDKTASCVVFRKTLEYLVKGHKKNNNLTREKVEKFENEDKNNDVIGENKGKDKSVDINGEDIDINNNSYDNNNNEDDKYPKNGKDDESNSNENDDKSDNDISPDANKNKDVVKTNDKGRMKIKIIRGKIENKEKAYKFIIEIKGEDVIVRKLKDTIDVKGQINGNYTGINNETSEDNEENEILSKLEAKIVSQGEGTSTDNDKGQDKSEHKCTIGKDNDTMTCIDDIIDYGHIFYDGPEAYMDFQIT